MRLENRADSLQVDLVDLRLRAFERIQPFLVALLAKRFGFLSLSGGGGQGAGPRSERGRELYERP